MTTARDGAGVKKQKDEATALLAQFEKDAREAQGLPAEPAPAAPASDPAASPKPAEGSPAPATLEPAPTTPAPAPASAPANAEETEVVGLKKQLEDVSTALETLQKEYAKLQQENSVLAGRLSKQGPEFAQQIKDLKVDVERLTKELETAKKGTPAGKPADEVSVKVTDSDKKRADNWGVAAEEIAEFRQDIISSVIAGLPKAPAAPEPGPAPAAEPAVPAAPAVQQPISPARQAFNTLLDVKAKGWREARLRPEFAAYVENTTEATTGRSLVDILAEADAQLDSNIVSRIYQAFFAAAKPAEPAPAPAKPSRETAPTSPRGGSEIPGEEEKWSLGRIQQFERDVATGKIKMGSEEYKTLKASRDKHLETATFGT